MTGEELYNNLSQRDYTGSDADVYAQTLQTLFFHLGEKLFPILKKAHDNGKKLEVKDPEGLFVSDYSAKDIQLV